MKKISSILYSLYLIIVFFYGIFIKLLYNTSFFMVLKYMPEIILLLFVSSLCVRYKIKIKKVDFIMLCFVTSIYIVGMISSFELYSFMIACRDFLIPILSLVIMRNMNIHEEEINEYYSIILFICSIFLVLSTVIGFIEYIEGWQFTSKFYTGHVFYGADERSSLVIKTAAHHVRAFGVVGDSAKYGFYVLISFCILNCKNTSLRKIIAVFIICFINTIFTTNKTSMVILLILLVYFLIVKMRIKNIFALVGIIAFAGALIIFNSPEKFQSIAERLYMWKSGKLFSIRNMAIGFDLYHYFGHPELWFNILDNTYLFGMAAFGMVSYILILIYLIRISFNKTMLSNSLLLIFLIGGITTNLFSARSFFPVFCFICGLFLRSKKNNILNRG